MPRNLLLLALTVLLMLAATIATAADMPTSFRGIPFGTSAKALGSATKLDYAAAQSKSYQNIPDTPSVACYERENDKLHIGEIQFKSIIYCFVNDKFYMTVGAYSEFDVNTMQEILEFKFGPNFTRSDDFLKTDWDWDTALVRNWMNLKGANLVIYSKPLQVEATNAGIQEQEGRDAEKRNRLEEWAKDF